MRQLERQEEYEERFALVSERVDQLKEDAEVPDPFASYFKEVAAFLGLVKKTYVCVAEGAYERLSLEERQKIHADLYGRLEPAVYEASYLNPEYAEETLGAELVCSACFMQICYRPYRMPLKKGWTCSASGTNSL